MPLAPSEAASEGQAKCCFGRNSAGSAIARLDATVSAYGEAAKAYIKYWLLYEQVNGHHAAP